MVLVMVSMRKGRTAKPGLAKQSSRRLGADLKLIKRGPATVPSSVGFARPVGYRNGRVGGSAYQDVLDGAPSTKVVTVEAFRIDALLAAHKGLTPTCSRSEAGMIFASSSYAGSAGIPGHAVIFLTKMCL